MNNFTVKLSALCFLGLLILSAYSIFIKPNFHIAHAQETGATREYTLLEPLPCIDRKDCENGEVTTKVDLVRYLNIIFKLAIALAGVLAVFMIVVGGFQYATTDAFQGKEDGKAKMWNAVQGLLFALVSYFILYTIDPRFVQFRALEPLGIKAIESGDLTVELGDLAQQTRATLEIYDEEIKTLRAKASHPDTSEEEAIDLLIQANELEKTSIKLRTDVLGNQNIKNALENIKNAELATVRSTTKIGNLDSETQKRIDLFRSNSEKNYDLAINELRNKGDLGAAQNYVEEKKYTLFTIDAEAYTKEALLFLESSSHIDNKKHAEKILKLLKDSENVFKEEINNQEIILKYNTESAARIKKIEDALK